MSDQPRVRTFDIPAIERLAAKHLQELGEDFTIPVDIERIVDLLDPPVDLDCIRGLQERHQVMAMVASEPDNPKHLTILVDESLMEREENIRRYRFTVAEEVAHILLLRSVIEQVKTETDFKALHHDPRWHIWERNSKRLAAALLMPAKNVMADSEVFYSQIVKEVGFIQPEIFKKFLAGKLADRYLVSVPPMKYRLDEWPLKVYHRLEDAIKNKLDFLP